MKKQLGGILLLYLLISLGILIGIAILNPRYLVDIKQAYCPDEKHLYIMGKNIVQHSTFSRCESAPYLHEGVRTPLYPLFIAINLLLFKGHVSIYFFQVIFYLISCIFLYKIASLFFEEKVALVAGLLVSIDLTSICYNFTLLGESVYRTFFILSIFYFLKYPLNNAKQYQSSLMKYKNLIISSIFLSLATLTRPSSMGFPFIGLMIMVLFSLRKILLEKREGKDMKKVLLVNGKKIAYGFTIFFSLFLILLSPWLLRNYIIFKVPRLTTFTTVGVYSCAAGAYQVEKGISRDEAQKQISEEYKIPSFSHYANPSIDLNNPELLSGTKLKKITISVLTKYPLSLVKSCIIGLINVHISHNVDLYAHMFQRQWNGGSMQYFITGRFVEGLKMINPNHFVDKVFFIYQTLFLIGTLLFCLVGICMVLKQESLEVRIALILITCYLHLEVIMVGVDAFSKYRVAAAPFVSLFSAYGIVYFINTLRRASIRKCHNENC